MNIISLLIFSFVIHIHTSNAFSIYIPKIADLSATKILELSAIGPKSQSYASDELAFILPVNKIVLGENLSHVFQSDVSTSVDATIGSYNTDNEKAFLWAAMQGRNNDVKKFLDQGVDVDVINKSGWNINMTALSFAISEGKIQTVKLLIKRGADVNWKLKNGFSQLMLASRCRGGGSIVEMLLDYGADKKDVEARGLTPLMMTCFFGNSKTASILIQHGSDVSSRDRYGYSALWYAAYNRKKSLINLLLRGGIDINIRDNCGRTVLMMSAASGNLSIVQLLLAAGCNPNARDKFRLRAIDYALANNHVEVAECLAGRK